MTNPPVAEKSSGEEVTPSKAKPYSLSSGGSTGFFSLGESNIAERAKQLRIERTLSNQSKQSETTTVVDDETTQDSKTKKQNRLQEFDSLLISNQIDETDNVLCQNLKRGFRRMREEDDGEETSVKAKSEYFATVNFIDPTTKPDAQVTPKSNILQQQSMLSRKDATIENVYQSLTFLFERDYGSTLRSVQYKNMRTGETNIISSLPVRPLITRNGGSTADSSAANESATSTNPNAPWGGVATTAIMPVSDPSEWHNGPFCHVYIAACEHTDHYRTKIRPALRAFVSQLETTASNTTANQQGGHSADYLIVYIPVGDPNKKVSSVTTPSSKSNSNSRVGFFGKARQRFGGGAANDDNDDAMSKDTMDSGDDAFVVSGTMDGDEYESGSINVLNALQHLNKNERALYKKIVTDFPNGKVSVISRGSLSLAKETSEEQLAIRVQEWNVFNRMLGAVIVNGFQDRLRKYKAELKRLDAQRATAVTASRNNGDGGEKKSNPYAFNLSHFFLVKESLAFSFEQMQLPAEALLQYDEFRLYMPDLSDKEESKVRRARRKSKALSEDSEGLLRLADAGDFLGFRKKIRTEFDLTAILDIMRRYLFAREVSLLVRMEEPVELLSRCQTFIKAMYSILLRGITEFSEMDQKDRTSKASAWVVQFSWDIYSASKEYLKTSSSSVNGTPSSSPQKRSSLSSKNNDCDDIVASKLREILEVARLFLLQLGDEHIGTSNPFSGRRKQLPGDLQDPWSPWVPPSEPDHQKTETVVAEETLAEKREFILSLDETLKSSEAFEATYLKLCTALILTSHLAKHYRLAARLQAELGEYHMLKGNYRDAATNFQKIVKVYRIDHWDRAHFWRIFRLAYCQRTTMEATAYLKTLCSCFSPRSAVVAPKKALLALFADLQRVIEHPSVGTARYSRLLFIETQLSMSLPKKKSASPGKLLDQKQIDKHFSSVGDKIQIPIAIKSYLPGSIELNSVKLFVVAVKNFKAILSNGDAIQEEDAFEVLAIPAPVQLNPGENNYIFEWTPYSSGQFILSTVEIVWKQGYFYYDSMDLQEPLLSLDVLPSKPTHAITIEPSVLVPGQDQEVQVTFDAGSDIITSGKLIFSGTTNCGIQLLPPGGNASSDWKDTCTIDLNACQPGETQVITMNVRCGVLKRTQSKDSFDEKVDSDNPTKSGLVANVETTYLHPRTLNEPSTHQQSSMIGNLEVFAPLLEKMAISVESIDMNWLDSKKERFLFSVTLTSNTESCFAVDGWSLQLAGPCTAVGGSDWNEHLRKQLISKGDQVSFAFEYMLLRGEGHDEIETNGPSKLELKLSEGASRAFSLDLPLDLEDCSRFISAIEAGSASETVVQATLKLDTKTGLVGAPVQMTFVIDPSCSDILPSALLYSIDCDSMGSWLIGGKVNGILEMSTSNELSFAAIPLQPGMLGRFPTMTLTTLGASPPRTYTISVECRLPLPFQSIPKTKMYGVASPTIKKKDDGRAFEV